VSIEVRVLGPVEVDRGDGSAERVHGLGARLLLALIVDRGRPVGDDTLVERLWSAAPPRHAVASVRNQVARLRRTFGSAIVGRDQAGYRVGDRVPLLDLDRFEAAVEAARGEADRGAAREHLDAALRLVRGRPLHEVADDVWAMPVVAGIAEQVAVAEELWGSLVVAGAGAADVARLRRFAMAQPHREVRWLHLVEAIATTGHRTEALRAAGEARRALAEFGMDPCRGLVEIERQLLGTDRGPVAATRVPARRDPIVGRDDVLADVLRPGQVVWLDGDPGTGKTRLIAELADRVDPSRTTVLYVACPRAAGVGSGCVPTLLAAAAELVPSSLRLAHEVAPDPSLDADVRRAGLAGVVVDRLRAGSSEREVVAVVDDVQWLEPSEATMLLEIMTRTLDVTRWIVGSRPVARHVGAASLRGELARNGAIRVVGLGDLTTADVRALLDEVAPELDDAARDRLAGEVSAVTGGHPLSVAEVVMHRDRLAGDRLPRLDAIVAGTLAQLDDGDRRLVDVLAVAAGPCPVTALATACRCPAAEILERAERLGDEGLVGPVVDGMLDLRHDLVRRAVERHLASGAQLDSRRALIAALAGQPRSIVAYADQLLRAGELLDTGPELARAVAASIRRQLDDTDYVGAGRTATRFLELGIAPAGAEALEAHLQAATALIATGDVGRGRATLLDLRVPARASGDLGILADTILAMGPLMTGGRETDDVLADAEHLVVALPRNDGSRRVQLACWAAHQLLLRGDRLRAEHLLELADADPFGATAGQGLVLAMRAQADTLVESSPDVAQRSLDELRRFAIERSDVTAEAAALLLGARQAWAHGTLVDVAAARDGIAALAERLPRPDVRWWPASIDASIALAAGRFDEAATAIETAGRLGRELRVAAAGPTARVQHLTMLYLSGALGSAAPALAHFASGPDATPGTVAGYGLACVEARDTAAVADVARQLAAEPRVLAAAGASWPLVAMCASEIAAHAGDRTLARAVRSALAPFCGGGLAMHSVGYFGTVDRCLGRLAVALGDPVTGVALLTAAVEQERQRGAAAWERRTVADLWAVRQSM
jgi:DNA-binding SARP family transcriptional activator